MATFALDLLSGKVFLFVPTLGSGGTSGGTFNGYPEVNTYADLPAAGAYNGKTYLVRTGTGAYILNRKESGFYYSNGASWYRLGDIPSFFNSSNFQLYDGTDTTKGFDFITSGITSGVFRQLKVQDKNGTIALLTDLNTKVDLSVFQYFTGTTAPNTYLNINNFDIYSGETLSLIQAKQDLLIAGNGIKISGNTISVKLPSALQLKDLSGGTEVNNITPIAINWITEEYSGNSLNFTGGSRIYIQETTTYELSYVVNLLNQTNQNKTIGSLIRKNGITDITPLSYASYTRNAIDNATTNSMPGYKVDLLNGDYIELIMFRIGGSGSVLTIPDGSWFKIEKII